MQDRKFPGPEVLARQVADGDGGCVIDGTLLEKVAAIGGRFGGKLVFRCCPVQSDGTAIGCVRRKLHLRPLPGLGMTMVEDRPVAYAAGRRRRLARGFRSGVARAGCRCGGGVVPGRRPLARRAGLYLDIQTMAGRAGDRGDAAPDARPHEAREFPDPAETDAAAPGQPCWHRMHRGDLRIRDGVWPGQRHLRLVPDSQGRLRAWTLNTNLHELGATKKNSSGARNPTRRAISAPKIGPTVSPASAPLPTAIRWCWSWAAARPGFRSRRGCINSASIR